jgi:hypothetical protein
VRKEITHLSTKVESPTVDDMRKLIHVNRYLKQTAGRPDVLHRGGCPPLRPC